MRRRVLLVALWLAGTAGATALVFSFLARLSTDLGTVSREDRLGQRQVVRSSTTAGPSRITTPSTTAVTSTAVATTIASTTSEPPAVTTLAVTPVDETEPGGGPPTTVRRPTATTRAQPVSPTAEPTVATTPPTQPTPAPTPPPTPSPTTAVTSPTTVPSGGTCSPGIRPIQRNVVSFRVCNTYDVYLVGAQPAPGWTFTVLANGPPVVSVRFISSASTVTCTVSVDGDGILVYSGDC